MTLRMKFRKPRHLTISAGDRLAVCAAIGIALGVLIGAFIAWQYTVLAAWDITAAIFVVSTWHSFIGSDAARTRQLALRLDTSRTISDSVLIIASVASLAAAGVLLGQAGSSHRQTLALAVATLSVLISWSVVHTIYFLRYATEYYKHDGGVEFMGSDRPRYSDFAYLAITVGLTFQVSDTQLTSPRFRSLVLVHSLYSYLFGSVILASFINMIVTLGSH